MILGTNRSVRVWAYARPADLRKGYNGLYWLVKNELGRDPLRISRDLITRLALT